MRPIAALVLLALLLPYASASTMGAYAGAGPSAQYQYGVCQVQGDTAVALSQNVNGSWSFDVHMLHLPIVGCDGMSVGTTSFPSALWSNDLRGSPATGFRAEGSYTLGELYAWELTVSPLAMDTAWSIHFQWMDGDRARESWWNGTATMAGAHA